MVHRGQPTRTLAPAADPRPGLGAGPGRLRRRRQGRARPADIDHQLGPRRPAASIATLPERPAVEVSRAIGSTSPDSPVDSCLHDPTWGTRYPAHCPSVPMSRRSWRWSRWCVLAVACGPVPDGYTGDPRPTRSTGPIRAATGRGWASRHRCSSASPGTSRYRATTTATAPGSRPPAAGSDWVLRRVPAPIDYAPRLPTGRVGLPWAVRPP